MAITVSKISLNES